MQKSRPSPGSSPRGRGTRHGHGFRLARGRFIPAGAGNASASPLTCCVRPVHPRGGGERILAKSRISPSSGSSPRGRGTLSQDKPGGEPGRFIPAGAGNAGLILVNGLKVTVHPRGGGERNHAVARQMAQTGSSPRGRGTRRQRAAERRRPRFIPAGAGNATPSPIRSPPSPVHPRGGGERVCQFSALGGVGGSSPRGRGTPNTIFNGGQITRFIPAGAGNAIENIVRVGRVAVHPRGGGERPAKRRTSSSSSGSSPRGRGTLFCTDDPAVL